MELFSAELKKELRIQLDSMLVGDFAKAVEKDLESLRRYGLIITTFYHIREVQSLLEDSGMEVVALMVDTSLETLMRLTSLPEGIKVAVACTTAAGTENMKLSIQRAGFEAPAGAHRFRRKKVQLAKDDRRGLGGRLLQSD